MTIKNVLKWENTAHITKMSIEGLVATASLAAAITTLLIATKVIAGPASLALIASPAGIAVLFITAVYFAAAAYVSYQQMYKNEKISGAKTGAETAAKEAEAAKTGAETAAKKAEAAKTDAETAAKKAEAAKTDVQAAIEAKTKDLATKTGLAEKLNSDNLREKVKENLPTFLVSSDVATVNVENALANSCN